jgi:hypothetical protein
VEAPPAGSWAAGLEVGFSEPFGSDGFDTGVLLGGFVERYHTETLGWRAGLAYLDLDGPPRSGEVELLMLHANLVYRWPVSGPVRPYVTGGVGLYRHDPDRGDDGTDGGGNAGGGVDFLIRRSSEGRHRIALRAETLLHATSGDEPDSFVQGTVGIKLVW